MWDALLQTLVDIADRLITGSVWCDSTVGRAHSQATGAKVKLIRRLLVDHAVTLRAISMPDVTLRDALSAL